MKDNIVIAWQDIIRPRKWLLRSLVLVMVMLSILAGWWVYRTPKMIGCMWEAGYTQSIPSNNYEYKLFSNTCVVKRGERWLPIDRGVDAVEVEAD